MDLLTRILSALLGYFDELFSYKYVVHKACNLVMGENQGYLHTLKVASERNGFSALLKEIVEETVCL